VAPPSGAGVGMRIGAVEVGDGLRLGGIKGRRLVELEVGLGIEAEVTLRGAAGRGEGWRCGGQAEVAEDGVNGPGLGEEGEDAQVGAAVGALEGEDLVDAGEETGPAGACGAVAGHFRRAGRRIVRGLVAFRFGAAEGDDAGAEPGVGRQHAVVAVAVDAGRRDEAGEGGEEVERREGEDGAAVERGAWQVIEDLAHAGPGCGP
jgi:hypothetical protein